MSDPRPGGGPAFSDHAVTILATEHWSLLSSRSLAYNDAFNRVTVFLTTTSASIVTLALVGNTAGLGRAFTLTALLLSPLVLFLGLTTYARLVQINLEDVLLVAAMNRLRNAYVTIDPALAPYFTTSWHDDEAGVWKSILLSRTTVSHPTLHFFVTTPTVIALIVAFISAAATGLFVDRVAESAGVPIVLSVVVFAVVVVSLFALQYWIHHEVRKATPRFPSEPTP